MADALEGAEAAEGLERTDVEVLLVSARDWFASALQAVLEPEGFVFRHARAADEALSEARSREPHLVILDEGLPDASASDLCQELAPARLRPSVPILVYSPNFWEESRQAEAMRAGAWDIIREPIRSRLLVAKLERLLRIKRLIETTEEGALTDAETGIFNLAGLMKTLPILGSLAERTRAPLSCAILGPTKPAESSEEREAQRRQTALLCSRHTRMSDVCAWVGESDLALIAYDANVEATTDILRRLESQAARLGRAEAAPLSGGIVELSPSRFAADRRAALAGEPSAATPVAERIASLSRFAAAQNALREAREAGGGIRIAEGG